MKKVYFFIAMVLVLSTATYAQKQKLIKYPFVNQTEFGLLFGRVNTFTYVMPYPYYSGYYPDVQYSETRNVTDLSLSTFNGFKIRKNTMLGLTLGLDSYSPVLINPVAIGLKQVLFEKSENGAKIQAGLDIGHGATWFNPKSENREVDGGIMVNPVIGFKFPVKNGSAWLINFGYKYQYYSITDQNNNEYYYYNHETRNMKRLHVRLGFEF